MRIHEKRRGRRKHERTRVRSAHRVARAKDGSFKAREFLSPSGARFRSLSIQARALRVSVSHLSCVLAGKRIPSWPLAMKWAAFLGVSVEGLWLALYGERGVVPAGSPVSRRLSGPVGRLGGTSTVTAAPEPEAAR